MENKEAGEVPNLPPFPANFSTVFVVSQNELDSLHSLKPFTQEWATFWGTLAANNETLDYLKSFQDNEGFNYLGVLADKKADANLILLLFVRYLWVNTVETYERKEPMIKITLQLLQAVRNVHFYYDEFYKKPSLAGFEWRKESPLSGEPSNDVERFLSEAEQKISVYLQSRDYTKPGMRSPPLDKVNRVIFLIHQHLIQKTGGPQWSTFLELLLAAGAIRRDIKKKKTAEEIVDDNPASRLSTHLKSFRTYHPKEASAIEAMMAKPLWPDRSRN